jgi:hypothetical protein
MLALRPLCRRRRGTRQAAGITVTGVGSGQRSANYPSYSRTGRSTAVPELERNRLIGCWLVAIIGLTGCGREDAAVGAAHSDPVEFRIPAIPARAPIETERLNSNVFDSICHIGNPFAVVGWELDAHTRFLYFVGPFNGAGDGLAHPYLYMAISASDRERMHTTLYLDSLDEPELRKQAKPRELQRFLLPHIVGLPANAAELRRQLGDPAHTLELESGLTRLIFARDVCLNEKRLVGVYADVDEGRLVAAKGVDHPEKLKWIVSAGRPPKPDRWPTYYRDWTPRERTAQAAALDFVFSLRNRDFKSARASLWQPDAPPHPLEDFAKVFEGSSIDTDTLTYQTTHYELDLAEVAVAFVLADGRSVRDTIELRDAGKKRWLVSDWGHDVERR